MMRAFRLVLASCFVATLAHAQGGGSVEKCTGNFEEAQLKEKRGKLVEAEQLYAACAATSCPSMVRADCTAKRDEVQRRIPTVTIVVRDPSGNDVTAYVEIDGKPIADRAHAQAVDPGEHTIGYRAEGKKPATQKVTVVEGEKARVITLSTKDGVDAPARANGEASTSTSTSTSQVASSDGQTIVGPVIVGTAGVLLLGAAIVVQALAQNEDDKSQEFTRQANDPSTSAENRSTLLHAASSRRDAAERNQLVAIVGGIGGLLFIAGGVTWFLLTRPSKPASTSFAPMIAPGAVGGSFGLRF
jgi:hypothetical protein